jgi:hypothetical protein
MIITLPSIKTGRKRYFLGLMLTLLAFALAGCISPEGYSEWQWKQYSPNYQSLPGDQR